MWKKISEERPPEGVDVLVKYNGTSEAKRLTYSWGSWYAGGFFFVYVRPDDEWRPYEAAGGVEGA